MHAKLKCASCGFTLKKAGVVKRTPLDKLDNGDHIIVKIEPCPVCMENKYKMGKAMTARRPRKS